MTHAWQAWCKGDLQLATGNRVEVRFAHGRGHVVEVQERERGYELTSLVVDASAAALSPYACVEALWQRNGTARLVGFQRDAHGNVAARSWIAKAGLVAAEFQRMVRHVAQEADRLEYLLTGTDEV